MRFWLERGGAMIVDRHLSECVMEGETVSPEAMTKLREALKLLAR